MSKYSELADALIVSPPIPAPDVVTRMRAARALLELEAENEELDRKNYKLDFYNTALKAAHDGMEAERDQLREALSRVLMWAPQSTEAACKQDYNFARNILGESDE